MATVMLYRHLVARLFQIERARRYVQQAHLQTRLARSNMVESFQSCAR